MIMKRITITVLLAVLFIFISPTATQSNDRLKACIGVSCGTLGNEICSITWYPNADGTVSWYWCVMITVRGDRIPDISKA